MGKFTAIICKSHYGITQNMAGRPTCLRREPTGRAKESVFHFRSKQRYEGRIWRLPELLLGSGMLRHEASLLIQNDNVNSSRSLSYTITMRLPRLRCSTNF